MTAEGKIGKQLDRDGNPVVQEVETVKKEGSGCCTIFWAFLFKVHFKSSNKYSC